ncbi:MAG: TIM barrel protein [Thermoguttaceae bacterium]|nr:TIM barrel protein [Thermoguttaceae bacterium]
MTSMPAERSAVSTCHGVSRRTAIGALSGSFVAGGLWPWAMGARAGELKGRIRQSVCLWCYNGYLKREGMNLDDFAAECAKMGLKSVELTSPDQWPTLKKHGLTCAMTPSHGITKGLNRVENHQECLDRIRTSIDDTADAGFPNVICFSGNREGMDDEEGLANCVTALKSIASYAEQKKVTICLEFLNSINHKDYMADTTAWCVKLVEKVGSPRVKVLYDIYHAAMMEEDVLADIRKHHECWGHYHTGGYPGRNEIDETQQLDYAKLMLAIVESGYKGYVGQEFVPKRPDALKSLRQAVALCDV